MTHIKIPTHFFEDDKLKAIRSQKDGDTVSLLYTMLITVNGDLKMQIYGD